jgi:ubiquinone/menaquinone biosynthesis C-methylase UbiE
MLGFFRKSAGRDDFTTGLAYAIGFRDRAYRQRAVDALALAQGDTVVELGCGTGRNFEMLARAVGPGGRVIGVDISDAMLSRARRRVVRHGWSNVELVRSDARRTNFGRRSMGSCPRTRWSWSPNTIG